MSKIKWTWSTTGFGFAGKTHEEICSLSCEAELAGIEGVAPLFDGMSPSRAEAVGDMYRDAGLRIETFHLPFGADNDIASLYREARKTAVRTARRWMEIAHALGSTVCIQHPAQFHGVPDAAETDATVAALAASLDELLPAAEGLNLKIALENMLPGRGGKRGRFGSHPEDFTRMLSEFGHPALGFCLDTGHALVAAHDKANEFLDAMAPGLIAFHLVDNAGDRDSHLAPGRGNVDWDYTFRGMHRLGYTGQACIETPPFAFGPDYQPEAWKQLVSDTEALALRALA